MNLLFLSFQRLGEVSPKLCTEEYDAALLEGNLKKNRDQNIHPGKFWILAQIINNFTVLSTSIWTSC